MWLHSYGIVEWRELWWSMLWQRPGGKKMYLSQNYHAVFGFF